MLRSTQQTIVKSVSLSGIGLHTGLASKMTLLPAGSHHGIKFQRVDLPGSPIIDADCDNVVDVSRGTTIEQSGARISTIEHTMAALVGLEIDNILIQVDSAEIPIMDGSSIQFVNCIKEAGFKEQGVPRDFYRVEGTVSHNEPERNVEIEAIPLDDYRVTVIIDYNSPILGSQHASIINMGDFEKEIASSRTFCFFHELEMLYKNNLIKGGSLNNATVIVDHDVPEDELNRVAKILNQPKMEIKKNIILKGHGFHHKNEPARHKLLDILGDLALVGKPLKAQILASRPGHAANVAFAKKLKKAMHKQHKTKIPYYDPNLPPVLNTNQILNVLAHRYPFLLIDKIIHLDNTSVVGVKNVTVNEPFFQGHFPNNMVMPGVLQVEAMAQIGSILLLSTFQDKPTNYWTYFIKIESFRFKKMVLPGDTLVMRCDFAHPIKRGIAKVNGYAYVGDKLVCEGTLIASIVKKKYDS